VETFAALKLEINSWRWQGVPFYIRAGKSLPVTSTEIICRLRKPPSVIPAAALNSNYLRFRISPDVAVAMGVTVTAQDEGMAGVLREMIASHHPSADEMDAYERVLGDAMAGDTTLFAREDYVEEAWRIVDPLLKKTSPVFVYEPNSWGPNEVERVTPAGGWQNPVIAYDQPSASGKAA
jgi:glucose-6-phosphate 1-dehydrogenase